MKFKRSYRDQLEANNRAQRGLEVAFGDIRAAKEAKGQRIPTLLAELPAKRVVVNRSDPDDLEASVLREVGELLAVHPKVLFAVRQNSGMAESSTGAPVWFYKLLRSPGKMRMVDYWGFLVTGIPFAIECKRRDWKRSFSDQREGEQYAFLEMIKVYGGMAGFVTSSADAQRILEGV